MFKFLKKLNLFKRGGETDVVDIEGILFPIKFIELTGSRADQALSVVKSHFNLLTAHFGSFRPNDNVVDMGCGVARIAAILGKQLTHGTYLGFDILKEPLAWSNKVIGRKYKNFTFHYFDIYDAYFNPSGSIGTVDVRIPVEDGSVDKVFALSLFTHLVKCDAEHYFSEMGRILKPAGKAIVTIFLYNDAILEASRNNDLTPWHLFFEHEYEPGCRLNNPKMPAEATAYVPEVINEMLEKNDLQLLRPPLTGAWSGYYESPEAAQEVLIIEKRAH